MKRDLHQEITDKIVAMIESGAGRWEMPWHGTLGKRPVNAVTGHRYNGVNVLNLWADSIDKGFATNQWATFKQWQEHGAQVRKGERGSLVVYVGQVARERTNDDGETEEYGVSFLKYSHTFNADQVDGFEVETVERPNLATRIAAADAFVANTGAIIRENQGRAFYNPTDDFIGMPAFDLFRDTDASTATENAYSTLLHELTHWTAPKKRLDREFSKRFGDGAYALEELVAELGAAFLCADLDITNEPRADHAKYLAHWLEVLKADKRAIFTAASKASEAAGYLADTQPAQSAAAA